MSTGGEDEIRIRNLNLLFDELAVEVGKITTRHISKPNNSLKIRYEIGRQAEQDRMLRSCLRPTKALADKLGRSESDLLHHRQFYRLIEQKPELLEKWVDEGLPWVRVVKELSKYEVSKISTKKPYPWNIDIDLG